MTSREPIKIHPAVREELRDLLLGPHFEGTGAGYTAVVKAAIERAHRDPYFREAIIAAQFTVSELDARDRR